MISEIVWWSVLVVSISPTGDILGQMEYRRYPQSQVWQCHARASAMSEQGKAKGFYGVCVETAKLNRS